MKRLVLFVEGRGDRTAGPTLARRVLNEREGVDVLFVDKNPFRVQSVGKLLKDNAEFWQRTLKLAGQTRKNVGGILLLLDGDDKRVASEEYRKRYKTDQFCAARVASYLRELATPGGAGAVFSLAIAFAVMEFESWIVHGIDKLGGVELSGGRGSIPEGLEPPPDAESIRDAKGWLTGHVPQYKPTLDQGVLAQAIDIDVVSTRSRSFRRFVNAILQIVEANRSGNHISTPEF